MLSDLLPGDHVVDHAGRACRVRRVVPCGIGQAVEVRLRDATAITTGQSQVLPVQVGPERTAMRCSARRIAELLSRRITVRLAACEPVEMPGIADLVVAPYILGLILGDGCITANSVTLWSTEEHLVRRFEQGLPAGSRLSDHPRRQPRCTGWPVVGDERGPGKNALLQGLRELDLCPVTSATKFIPAAYAWSPIESRVQLLQGLCDSDAGVDSWGRVRWSSASPQLAEGVATLCKSLGGRVTVQRRSASYSVVGESGVKPAQDSYKVNIRLLGIQAFSLPRKAERVRPAVLTPQWCVAGVHAAGVAPMLSIETGGPTESFIAGTGFVPVTSLAPEAAALSQRAA
jgi:hypothetical protein